MRKSFFFLLALCIASLGMFAQPENSQWHFGNGIGVSFLGASPEIVTSGIDTPFDVTPSCISNLAGDLVCYTEGSVVLNSNHEVVTNGEFSNLAAECMIVPNPELCNTYYVFRTGSWGVDYSIVDFNTSDDGVIAAGEKEISISAIPSNLMCAKKDDASGHWFITADNDAGGGDVIYLNVFSIDAGGINFSGAYQYEYFWAGWNETLDDATISPDCSTISASYKGHYVCFMKFNNVTGEVYDFIFDGLDTGASFTNVTELEFSPSGQFLYCLGDFNTIRQYNLATWDFYEISSSGTSVSTSATGTWKDLKVGTDGKLWILNDGASQLDVINFPDNGAEEVGFESGILALTGVTTYFPNTPNLLCSSIFDLNVDHQYICYLDETEFWHNYVCDADSSNWMFDDPDSGVNNVSSLHSPIHVFSAPGDYVVELTLFIDGIETMINEAVTIYSVPTPDLGPDFTLCEGIAETLAPGSFDGNYDWSTTESTETIEILVAGDYTININNEGCIGSDEISVDMIPIVSLEVTEDIFLCNDYPVELWATMSGQTDFIWNNGVESEVIFVDESGTYWMTASNACFTEVDSVTVTLISLPEVLLPSDFEACIGDTVPLTSAYPDGNITWSTGESGVTIDINATGTYSVQVEVMGCETEDEIFVEFFPFVPMEFVKMPNVFSPDYVDNHNTNLRPFLSFDPQLDFCSYETIDIQMKVYDRWGNEAMSDGCSWNGTDLNGEPVAESVYYYIIDLHSTCMNRDERDQKAGHVTLLRTFR